MLEMELFAFLDRTADSAFTVTEQGEICSWNRSAEELFGYQLSDVLTGLVMKSWTAEGH